MSSFLAALSLIGILWSPAQYQANLTTADRPFVIITDEPPQFPGGMNGFTDYLKKNLHYPKAARKAKLEGRVSVNFIVTAEGHIEDVKLYNSLGLGTDEEAVRLIESMPDWIPGKQSGKAVSMRYNLPIDFRLN